MLGDKIRLLRKKEKLTLKELGAKVGSTEAAMSLYETNKRTPEYELLKRIALVFEIPCAYLLEEGIFSKIDWIDEHYAEIMDNLIQNFGDRFQKAYELSKDFTADEKALLLSSIISNIELDDSNASVTEAKIHYYYDSPSYDDIIDLKSIYEEKFGVKMIDDEQNILYLHDFNEKEKEQIKNFALFIQQNRDK